MKKIIIAVLFVCNIAVLQAQDTPIVLELFTSQGCSSCPRADQLLKKISESNQGLKIIALAYHVDYWDRLGWKDPFSKQAYSNYQRQYGQKFGTRSIYTPQLVINGNQHIVGSDEVSLNRILPKLNTKKLPLKVELSDLKQQPNRISANYSVGNEVYNSLSFVLVLKEKITSVKKGENRNRTLVDTHIVLDKKVISQANDKSGTIYFDLESKYNSEELEIVAYAQNKDLSVLGASKLDFF